MHCEYFVKILSQFCIILLRRSYLSSSNAPSRIFRPEEYCVTGQIKLSRIYMCAEQHVRRFPLADKNAIRTHCSIYKLIYWTLHVNDCINTSSKKKLPFFTMTWASLLACMVCQFPMQVMQCPEMTTTWTGPYRHIAVFIYLSWAETGRKSAQ